MPGKGVFPGSPPADIEDHNTFAQEFESDGVFHAGTRLGISPSRSPDRAASSHLYSTRRGDSCEARSAETMSSGAESALLPLMISCALLGKRHGAHLLLANLKL